MSARAIVVSLLAGGPALAGPLPERVLTQSRLEMTDLQRVEPIVGDAGPLSPPGRVLSSNLRVPNDFMGVYRIPSDARTPYAGWYARGHGGVIAVFPRAEYAYKDKEGLVPLIPGGTQYLLGGIPLGMSDAPGGAGAPAMLSASRAIDRRVSLAVNAGAVDPRPSPARGGRGATTFDPLRAASRKTERLALDEPYRAARVSDLMARAAGEPGGR